MDSARAVAIQKSKEPVEILEGMNSLISCWQCDTTCETTGTDPLFLKALQEDGLYEKAIPVRRSLRCEGVYAVGKPCPSSHGSPGGMHRLLAEQQHQMGENRAVWAGLEVPLLKGSPQHTPSLLQASAKQAKATKPPKLD